MPQNKLFYIIGASGSGKTTLVNHVRKRLNDSTRLIFAHRYITRPIDRGFENHISLSEAEYEQRLQNGLFAMHWYNQGDSFGVGIEINLWLGKGLDVIVIGSRSNLDQAANDYPELQPVMLLASSETLRRRLRLRQLNPETIERRLQRVDEYQAVTHPKLIRINNDGLLESASNELCSLLTNTEHLPCC